MGRRLVAGPTCQTRCFITLQPFCLFVYSQNAAGQNTNHVFSHDFKPKSKTESKIPKIKKSFDACILLANIYMFAFIVYCCFLNICVRFFDVVVFCLFCFALSFVCDLFCVCTGRGVCRVASLTNC